MGPLLACPALSLLCPGFFPSWLVMSPGGFVAAFACLWVSLAQHCRAGLSQGHTVQWGT